MMVKTKMADQDSHFFKITSWPKELVPHLLWRNAIQSNMAGASKVAHTQSSVLKVRLLEGLFEKIEN